MRKELRPHPDTPSAAVERIEAKIVRPGPGALLLRYALIADMARVRLPPRVSPSRADELWRHTCFEAFVRTGEGSEYFEFNFAPSTQWAAYRFNRYREGMIVAMEVGAPRIEVRRAGERLTLEAALDLPGDACSRTWRIGLSAGIEETDGARSHWALEHPPGKPDFHHSDCFAIELAAAEPA